MSLSQLPPRATSTHPVANPQPDASGGDSSELRGDGAHSVSGPHLPPRQFESSGNPCAEISLSDKPPEALAESSRSSDRASAPRVETDQIALYLESQYNELDRREQLLHSQLAQFDQERRAFRLLIGERSQEVAARESAVDADRVELDQRLSAATALERELQDLRESLLRERHSLNLEREQFESEREQDRARFADECRQIRLEIDHLKEDAEADAARIRDELRQEQVLAESRLRFQQEHLQRTMRDFEKSQIDFRREQQQARTRLTETESQIVLRNQQLDRVRKLLIERQHSIERERQWLLVERRAVEGRIRDDREELRAAQTTWEQERETQKSDLRRQHDMLALHADNLESRRQRLDGLRVELEETNRQTLEMRLAVEESYAQLTQTVGNEVTRARVEEARQILIEYYRHTREALFAQRQELEQLQAKLRQQRQEFLDERKELAEWVAQQEEQFAAREQAVVSERAAVEAREQAWRDAAERWNREKLEAESVIRDLLRQLDTQ